MKEDTIDKIAYLTGRYQFRAESCTSPEKKEAYSEIYNDLRGLLELARDNENRLSKTDYSNGGRR